MPLKAVLFDVGLTLTKTASFPEIYRSILNNFGIKASIEAIIQAQKATKTEFEDTIYLVNRRKEYWAEYNASLLKKLGVEDNQLFLAEQIDALWWEYSHLQVYPDVESTLSLLKTNGLKLGVISNGLKRDLEHVLHKLQLTGWFDVVVCIDSCNCAKPSKEIFLYALNELEVEAGEVLFVGDSVMHDYEGASNVGIKPLLIDREGKIQGGYDKITSLTELLTIVYERGDLQQ